MRQSPQACNRSSIQRRGISPTKSRTGAGDGQVEIKVEIDRTLHQIAVLPIAALKSWQVEFPHALESRRDRLRVTGYFELQDSLAANSPRLRVEGLAIGRVHLFGAPVLGRTGPRQRV